MAIRQVAGRPKPWIVYYNNPFTGKRQSQAFASKTEAEKEDSLVKHQLKFDRERFRPAEEVKEVKAHTLETAYYAYLKEKKFDKKGLNWQLDSMKITLGLIGTVPLTDLSFDHLQQAKQALLNLNTKALTVRVRLAVLRAVVRWCFKSGLIESLPRFPEFPKAICQKFIPPTPEELSMLYTVAQEHIKRVIILGSQFGIRVGQSEMFKLKWSDIDLLEQVIRVPAAKKNPNEPWREIPIKENLQNIILEWQNQDIASGAIYVIHYKNNPVTTIKTAWNYACKKAGITRRIRPYDLRHAFATELLASGNVDVGTVAKLMGHTSPVMVLKHYQHISDKQKRRAVELLPDSPHVYKSMCTKKEGLLLEQ